MYFKFFKPQNCAKISDEGRRPFIQSFLYLFFRYTSKMARANASWS